MDAPFFFCTLTPLISLSWPNNQVRIFRAINRHCKSLFFVFKSKKFYAAAADEEDDDDDFIIIFHYFFSVYISWILSHIKTTPNFYILMFLEDQFFLYT